MIRHGDHRRVEPLLFLHYHTIVFVNVPSRIVLDCVRGVFSVYVAQRHDIYVVKGRQIFCVAAARRSRVSPSIANKGGWIYTKMCV